MEKFPFLTSGSSTSGTGEHLMTKASDEKQNLVITDLKKALFLVIPWFERTLKFHKK